MSLLCFSLYYKDGRCLKRVLMLSVQTLSYVHFAIGTHTKCRQDFSTFFIIHMLSQIARIKDINVVCSSIKDLLYLLHNHVYIVSLGLRRCVQKRDQFSNAKITAFGYFVISHVNIIIVMFVR